MSDISALGLCDCLCIWRGKWILCNVCIVLDVGYWIHKYTFSFREGKNDGVILTAKNGGLLAIDNAGRLVPILRKDDFHVLVWEDRIRVDNGRARDVADGAFREQTANDDLIDPLRCFPRDCHYGGVTVLLIGVPDLLVGELSVRAEDYSCLHFVHLLLASKHKTYEVEKFRVLWVDNTKLLIERVNDCV